MVSTLTDGGCSGEADLHRIWHRGLARDVIQVVLVDNGDIAGAGIHLHRQQPADERNSGCLRARPVARPYGARGVSQIGEARTQTPGTPQGNGVRRLAGAGHRTAAAGRGQRKPAVTVEPDPDIAVGDTDASRRSRVSEAPSHAALSRGLGGPVDKVEDKTVGVSYPVGRPLEGGLDAVGGRKGGSVNGGTQLPISVRGEAKPALPHGVCDAVAGEDRIPEQLPARRRGQAEALLHHRCIVRAQLQGLTRADRPAVSSRRRGRCVVGIRRGGARGRGALAATVVVTDGVSVRSSIHSRRVIVSRRPVGDARLDGCAISQDIVGSSPCAAVAPAARVPGPGDRDARVRAGIHVRRRVVRQGGRGSADRAVRPNIGLLPAPPRLGDPPALLLEGGRGRTIEEPRPPVVMRPLNQGRDAFVEGGARNAAVSPGGGNLRARTGEERTERFHFQFELHISPAVGSPAEGCEPERRVAVGFPELVNRRAVVRAPLLGSEGEAGPYFSVSIIEERHPLVRLAVVVQRRPYQDLRVAVPVHVPSRPNGTAEARAVLVAIGHPGGRGRQPRGRPQVHVGPPLVCLAAVVMISTHDHIRVAVTVHVPSRPNGTAEVCAVLVALRSPGGRGRQPRRGAQIDICPSLFLLAVVVPIRPHDHIGVAVPVHVPSRPNGSAEIGVILVALGRPGRSGRKPRGRARVHKCPPLI